MNKEHSEKLEPYQNDELFTTISNFISCTVNNVWCLGIQTFFFNMLLLFYVTISVFLKAHHDDDCVQVDIFK